MLFSQKNIKNDFLKIAGFLHLVAILIPILPSEVFLLVMEHHFSG